MKIRTDFVTNSSSSSFVVEVEVELTDKSRYVFETKLSEYGTNSNFGCSGEAVANTTDVADLCRLLESTMSGTGKTKFKTFLKEIQENVEDFSELDSITLRRIWISMGESSGLTVVNDEQLQNLSQAVVKAKGEAKKAACEALEEYLKTAEIYIQGGWQDEWPSGFVSKDTVARYKWDHLGLTVEALAKKIAGDKIDHNDLAVETIFVDLQNKTVKESADFIMDSKDKGIGKKPAIRSNKAFRNIFKESWPDYELRQNVPVTDLKSDYAEECDPLDYVLYKDGVPLVASSVKTAERAKSKAFKAQSVACMAIGLEYVLLDEKKDSTAAKVIPQVNQALFSERFRNYVIRGSEEGVTVESAPNSGAGHSVKVKFDDNRSYEYNAFGEIHVGDVVYVGGAKAGHRGMVLAITGDETFPGYYNVEQILKF